MFNDPQESDFLKASSVALGVFMGIAPIWGFQLVSAIALALLLRLNKTLVIIAANISIPPMIPLIIYLSHRMGGWWLGARAQEISFTKEITLAFIHEHALQYFVGALTLAALAALVAGVVSFCLLRFVGMTRKRRRRNVGH